MVISNFLLLLEDDDKEDDASRSVEATVHPVMPDPRMPTLIRSECCWECEKARDAVRRIIVVVVRRRNSIVEDDSRIEEAGCIAVNKLRFGR